MSADININIHMLISNSSTIADHITLKHSNSLRSVSSLQCQCIYVLHVYAYVCVVLMCIYKYHKLLVKITCFCFCSSRPKPFMTFI